MKKLISILSIATAPFYIQSCIPREEDIMPDKNHPGSIQHTPMMRQDSARSSEEPLEPDPTDPPVRDGDNWRLTHPH